MTAPHFFVDSVEADRLLIEGDDAHHAVKALRIAAGELITVSDGSGRVAEAKVLSAGAALEADVVERRFEARAKPAIVVYQAVPKHAKMESIIQDLVEVGAGTVVPLFAARSIPRWDAAKKKQRLQRWRAVAKEAGMQSRRAWLARIEEFADTVPDGALFLHEEAEERLTVALPAEAPEAVIIAVGPEGGFEAREITGRAVSLGRNVLRTETAALVACSIVLARYGILG